MANVSAGRKIFTQMPDIWLIVSSWIKPACRVRTPYRSVRRTDIQACRAPRKVCSKSLFGSSSIWEFGQCWRVRRKVDTGRCVPDRKEMQLGRSHAVMSSCGSRASHFHFCVLLILPAWIDTMHCFGVLVMQNMNSKHACMKDS